MAALAALYKVAIMTVESQNLIWRPMAVSDGAAMADLLNAIDAEDHVWGQYTAEDAAEELDASKVTEKNVKKVAKKVKVDGVVWGKVEKDGDSYTLKLKLRAGKKETARAFIEARRARRPHGRALRPARGRGGGMSGREAGRLVQAAGAVRPTHRRQGLGTKLMQHGLATAEVLHALHHPTLQLVVGSIYGEHVHGAVALYRAAGMTATKWGRHMRHPLGTAIPDAVPKSPWRRWPGRGDPDVGRRRRVLGLQPRSAQPAARPGRGAGGRRLPGPGPGQRRGRGQLPGRRARPAGHRP